jgi:flagellar hook-associated protein 2
VRITQAAEQASLTSNAFGTLAQAETIAVTTIGGTVTYQALGGSDAATVAAGLNAALGAANAGATAAVVGGAVKITTTGFGASATLSVTAGAGTGLTGSSTGVNVAGTIDGKAATGSGQILTSTTDDAEGLMLKITATAADVAGAGGDLDLGSVSFSQGAVGGLSKVLGQLTGTGGKVTASKDGATANSKAQQGRIDDFEARLELVQQRYTRQFAALETLMGQLKDQGSWLAAQIAGLPKWGG